MNRFLLIAGCVVLFLGGLLAVISNGGCRPTTLFFYSEADLNQALFDAPVAVERCISKEGIAAETALKELFAGPTDAEQEKGARGSEDLQALSASLIGVSIDGNIAIVNFKPEALAILNSAAARQLMAKAPIEATLRDFPGVTEIQYAIDGTIFEEWDA